MVILDTEIYARAIPVKTIIVVINKLQNLAVCVNNTYIGVLILFVSHMKDAIYDLNK